MAGVYSQAHHIIPKNVFDTYAEDIARVFDLENGREFQQIGSNFIHLHPQDSDASKVGNLLAENPNLFGDIPIGATSHSGSHPAYDTVVKTRLAEISDPDNKSINDVDKKLMVLDLQAGLKEALTKGIPPSINGDGFDATALNNFLDFK